MSSKHSISENAHAVIFPAFGTLDLSEAVKRFLSKGGCSILFGETRDEYLAREMSDRRKNEENRETILKASGEARLISEKLLVAVDQEILGICRLHNLVPPFPSKENLSEMPIDVFEQMSSSIASAAKEMGVNCFLGPILDIIKSENPWLKGRTWTSHFKTLADISAAFIRGVQSKGVSATAKHFPGFSDIKLDPAVHPDSIMTASAELVEESLMPFEQAIKNRVEIVMMGPAIVNAIDPEKPASLSPKLIGMLKNRLMFNGLVMSDDLDAKATLRGRPISDVAVDALEAGCDMLLIADLNDQIDVVASSIIDAVESGKLGEQRLGEAAEKVRLVTDKYS